MRKKLALHDLRKEMEERAMWKGKQAGGEVLSWTVNLGIFLQNQNFSNYYCPLDSN